MADATGVVGPPLYICPDFSFSLNLICHAPKLSPDGALVAFGIAETSSTSIGELSWYVVVVDRAGEEVLRYEGLHYPDWTPDGRLVMLGTNESGAGVWLSDETLLTANRIDEEQVATMASGTTVSPDGGKVAFVWNSQLWTLSLDGLGVLEQVTEGDLSVGSAVWSPDGSAFAILYWRTAIPETKAGLFRPGEPETEIALDFYPYGPISWQWPATTAPDCG